MNATAVVFGYGDVGVGCVRVLMSQDVDVKLVVTHEDDPAETRWYASLAEFATAHSLPVLLHTRVDDRLLYRLRALAPDFIFSFYFRQLLPATVLATARRGALNMHGSLLPRFRGRAPVNWAVLRGAEQTGATLHYMVERADAGDIVDQEAVPIGDDDTAHEVFKRVAGAAQTVLTRSLPKLVAGTAERIPQDLSQGEYCGRRRPEDGRIDWSRPARDIHNLVRAVAPPFPGAFTDVGGERWLISRTRVLPRLTVPTQQLVLQADAGECVVTCRDGQRLAVLEAISADGPIDLASLRGRLEHSPLPVN